MIPTTLKATGSVLLTDELRSFVEEKVGKVEKFLDQPEAARADVELATTGGSRTGEQFRAEINLHFPAGFARAEATRDTMHAAIDEAVAEVKGELRKYKTKHRDLLRRGSAKVKDFFRYFRG